MQVWGWGKAAGSGWEENIPWRISLTSSGVRRRPSSPGLFSVAMPPRKPQSTTVKRTCVTGHVHFWLYLKTSSLSANADFRLLA